MKVIIIYILSLFSVDLLAQENLTSYRPEEFSCKLKKFIEEVNQYFSLGIIQGQDFNQFINESRQKELFVSSQSFSLEGELRRLSFVKSRYFNYHLGLSDGDLELTCMVKQENLLPLHCYCQGSDHLFDRESMVSGFIFSFIDALPNKVENRSFLEFHGGRKQYEISYPLNVHQRIQCTKKKGQTQCRLISGSEI